MEVIRKEISWGSAFKDIDTPEAYSGNQNRDPTEDPFSGKKILSKGHSLTWKLLVWGEVIGSKVVRSVRIPSSPIKQESIAVERKPHMLVAHGGSFEQVPEPAVL